VKKPQSNLGLLSFQTDKDINTLVGPS
jgi:hypothetical protein